jgi:hypothetical protein
MLGIPSYSQGNLFLSSIGLVLLLQIRLLLFTDLLINLCTSRWLVAMRLCYRGSIFFVKLVILGQVGIIIFLVLSRSVSGYFEQRAKWEIIPLLHELVCWQWSAGLWGRRTDGCFPCLRESGWCRRQCFGCCRRLVLKT